MPTIKSFPPGALIPNSQEQLVLDARLPGTTIGFYISASGNLSASLWGDVTETFLKYVCTASQFISGNFRQVRTHADTTIAVTNVIVLKKAAGGVVD